VSSEATFCSDPRVSVGGQVSENFIGFVVEDPCPDWDLDFDGRGPGTGLLLASTVFPGFCAPQGLAAQFEKSRSLVAGDQQDVAASSTVAAIGPAEGNELLAAKRATSVPTSTAGDNNFRLVDEPHCLIHLLAVN
jgi:hypothetical protein